MPVGRLCRVLTAAAVAVGSVVYVGLQADGGERRAAAATPPTVSIPVGAALRGYLPPTVYMNRGQTLQVVNHDGSRHTVTSVARTKSGSPLFSAYLLPHQTVHLPSTAHLAPGKYGFYCNFHVRMKGTLVVRGTGGGTTGAAQTFAQPLVVPPAWNGKPLAIARTPVRVMPSGPLTTMWTYGGSYPGPTIRRTTGSPTTLNFVNKLPYSFSVHLHGDHHRSQYDGQPTTHLIPPYGTGTYVYPLTDGVANGHRIPERGGFFYYHDHRMGATARNNWMGLQGMFIVADPDEASLGLPNGKYDVPLMVTDRSFTATNQLTNPFGAMSMMPMGPTAPPNDATIGNRILVNGRYSPYFNVATHKYRFRLLNTSTFQSYDFKLSNGGALWQVGTGDSLLPTTVPRTDILLGPAQRADVVVSFDSSYGKRINLVSVPRHVTGTGVATPAATIMQFRVTTKVADTSRVPSTLRTPPPLPANLSSLPTKTWRINPAVHTAKGSYWTINRLPYKYNRLRMKTVTQGTSEKWTLVNASGVTHYVHLHEEQWQTLLRDGKPPPAWERGLQDTWKLDPGESVVVVGTFTDYPGIFMIHCHMLDHEDHGLMAEFKVVPPTSSAARSTPSSQGLDRPPFPR